MLVIIAQLTVQAGRRLRLATRGEHAVPEAVSLDE